MQATNAATAHEKGGMVGDDPTVPKAWPRFQKNELLLAEIRRGDQVIVKNFWFRVRKIDGGLKLDAVGPSGGLARRMRREAARAKRRVGNGRGGHKYQQVKRRNARRARRDRRRREAFAAQKG